MHAGEVGTLYVEIILVVAQTLLEGTLLLEGIDHLLEGHHALGLTHALIKGGGPVGGRAFEESHVARLHEVLQLGLVALDVFVDAAHLLLIALVLQIEFALLGHIAEAKGDIYQLIVVVVDGVEAHLYIAVHAALHNHTLGAEIQLLGLMVIEDVAEGGQIVERAVEVEGVALGLELQDLAHLLIGIEQMAVLIVEGESGKALLEEHTVALGEVLLALQLHHLVGDVGKRAEEVHGGLLIAEVFGDAHIAYVAPFAPVLLRAPVPAVGTLGGFLAIEHAPQEVYVDIPIVGVDIVETLIIVHTSGREEVAVHILTMAGKHG